METMSAPRYISSLQVRLQNGLVTYFPRKHFGFLRHSVQDKYYSHPLLLNKTLQPAPAPPLPEGYRFGLADEASLRQIMAHREALPAAVYHNRLAKGDVCYCLSVNDEVVNFNWISSSQCGLFRGFDKEVNFLALAPHQIFTYDFYTYRNKRKLGYGTILKQQLFPVLAASGCAELLSCVAHDNAESLRIHMKSAYCLKALPCNYRIMDWQWTTWGSPAQILEAREWLERFKNNSNNRSQRT